MTNVHGDDPKPRGPEDEQAGEADRSETLDTPSGKDKKPAPPPSEPMTPDANPIDPRVFGDS